MSRFEKVIIVGGGPAGASCAIWLRKLGFPEVVILERKQRGRDKPCAGGISPRAIPELQKLALFEQVRERSKVIRGAYLWRPDGSRPLEMGGKLALSIRRTVFDALLLDHAERLGARVEHGSTVDHLLEDRGPVRGVGAGKHEHEADVVVLATGARNRLCWDPRPRRRVDSVIRRFEGGELEPDMMRFNYHRRIQPFYVWLFPEPEGTVNIGCCRYPGQDHGESLATVLDELQHECFPDLDGAQPLGRPRGHAILSTTHARYLTKPGALRVGEAAWLTDSFTGEGIWHALASGKLAARAIAAGDLDLYALRARRLFDPALLVGDWLAWFATTRAWSWSLRASELRPVKAISSMLMSDLGKWTAGI